MSTDLSWVEGPWLGRVAIAPRPRGGDWIEDEVRAWRQAGIHVVVSLLTADEIAALDLSSETEACKAHGVRCLSFPIEDRGVPASRQATVDFVKRLEAELQEGKNVAIHCRQGIGRAALMAACLLVAAGVDADEAFRRLSAARRVTVPETTEQRQWVVAAAGDLTKSPRAIRDLAG